MTSALLTSGDLACTDIQQEQARELVEDIAQDNVLPQFQIVLEDSTVLSLEPQLSALILSMIAGIANTGHVSITQTPDELTPAAAAGMLGISRPTLMKLIRDGVIESHKVGSHNRVKTNDIISFASKRHSKKTTAFTSLREISEGLEEAQ